MISLSWGDAFFDCLLTQLALGTRSWTVECTIGSPMIYSLNRLVKIQTVLADVHSTDIVYEAETPSHTLILLFQYSC